MQARYDELSARLSRLTDRRDGRRRPAQPRVRARRRRAPVAEIAALADAAAPRRLEGRRRPGQRRRRSTRRRPRSGQGSLRLDGPGAARVGRQRPVPARRAARR